MVAGLCIHFLVNWSVRCVAWLVFIGGIARIALKLECTAGSSAMLCPRMHELQLYDFAVPFHQYFKVFTCPNGSTARAEAVLS